MRVDFYQLTRDPPAMVLPAIAQNIIKAGHKLLVVSAQESLETLSKSLWSHRDDSFLAHAIAGEGDDAIQPILLSDKIENSNAASMIALCDGHWRAQALSFERAFYMFSPDQIDDARGLWKNLMATEGLELHYWKQEGRKWVEGPSRK